VCFMCSAISLPTSDGDSPSGTAHPCRSSPHGTSSTRSVSRSTRDVVMRSRG
jgi:hypothetical protein